MLPNGAEVIYSGAKKLDVLLACSCYSVKPWERLTVHAWVTHCYPQWVTCTMSPHSLCMGAGSGILVVLEQHLPRGRNMVAQPRSRQWRSVLVFLWLCQAPGEKPDPHWGADMGRREELPLSPLKSRWKMPELQENLFWSRINKKALLLFLSSPVTGVSSRGSLKFSQLSLWKRERTQNALCAGLTFRESASRDRWGFKHLSRTPGLLLITSPSVSWPDFTLHPPTLRLSTSHLGKVRKIGVALWSWRRKP